MATQACGTHTLTPARPRIVQVVQIEQIVMLQGKALLTSLKRIHAENV